MWRPKGGHKIIFAETDHFDLGRKAFEDGLSPSDCPKGLGKRLRFWWIGGFRSAERNALNPPMPIEEYDRISREAETAYLRSYETGIPAMNPYPEETEAHEIWSCRMYDYPRVLGHEPDDFEVLGQPASVTEQPNNDGTVTYTLHRRG